MEPTYPGVRWDRDAPAAPGFDSKRLASAGEWIDRLLGDMGYRVLVVRRGVIAAEWIRGIDPDAKLMAYSAGKPVFGNIPGIAVAS